MNPKTKENVLAVVLAIIGLVFVTAFVGWVFSLEPQIKPFHVYITNTTVK